MTLQGTPENRFGRDGWVTRWTDWIFGYDFFLSYSHADGLNLPRHIKDRLTRAGFHVFLDQTEYVAGIDLRRETRRQVRKSRKVVVIARPVALASPWVKREVEVALDSGKTPVILNINSAVEAAPADAALAAMAREHQWLRLHETLANADGEPTDRVIAELVRGFDHTRQETKRQRIFAIAAAVLALTAAAAVWQAVEANSARRVAEAQRDRAERVLDQVVATANRRVQSLADRLVKKRAAATDAPVAPSEPAAEDAPSGEPLTQATEWIARGDAAMKSGDAAMAKTRFQTAFDALETGADANAKDWTLTRLKALDRLADAAEKQHDPQAAIAALTKSVALAEAQAVAEPNAVIFLQAQAATRQRLAGFALQAQDAASAESYLKAAMAAWQALSQDERHKTLAQRELAITTSGLGDLELQRERTEPALQLFYQSLALLKPLAASGPVNVETQGDLSAIYQRIADAQLKAGKPAKALIWVDADVAVATYIASQGTADPARQRDLASSHDRSARTLEMLGRDADALEAYRKGSRLFEEAIANNPHEPAWQRDAAAILESSGKLLGKTNRPDDAIRAFRRALSIREGLAASFEEPSWQREVEAAYRRASEIMLSLGRTTEAVETAEQYLLSTSLMSDKDGSRAERIGRALGTLSWSALLARDFSRAEWAGKQAVILAPNLNWVRLNYAHALMLSGHRDKAKALYLDGLVMPAEDAKAWRASVAKDFASLRKQKLDDPLMSEVLAKIGS